MKLTQLYKVIFYLHFKRFQRFVSGYFTRIFVLLKIFLSHSKEAFVYPSLKVFWQGHYPPSKVNWFFGLDPTPSEDQGRRQDRGIKGVTRKAGPQV